MSTISILRGASTCRIEHLSFLAISPRISFCDRPDVPLQCEWYQFVLATPHFPDPKLSSGLLNRATPSFIQGRIGGFPDEDQNRRPHHTESATTIAILCGCAFARADLNADLMDRKGYIERMWIKKAVDSQAAIKKRLPVADHG